jgi:hypothetical protein
VSNMQELNLLCILAPLFLVKGEYNLSKPVKFNDYEICGDVTKLFLTKKDGNALETLISTSELSRLLQNGRRWNAGISGSGYCYASGYVHKTDGKLNPITLHRFITNAIKGLVVDHINRNTLDNRNENLRVVKQRENCQNKKIQSNNKTGVRGVIWRMDQRKYIARVKIFGKYTHIGRFDNLKDAEDAVKKARSEMMPFSEEAM